MNKIEEQLKGSVRVEDSAFRAGAREERNRILQLIREHRNNWRRYDQEEKAHAASVIAADILKGKE